MSKNFTPTAAERERILAPLQVSPEQKRAAARLAASMALDVADCADLLEHLGLTPQDGGADIVRALERRAK